MIRRFAIYNHVKKMVNINRSEYAAVIWSFVYFFSLLGSYYILRPIRDEMGVIAGIDKLQWLFTATFIAMLLAVPLFGYVTSRLQRKSFLPYIYYFFIGNILLFYLLFESGISQTLTARIFFVWLSVFNLFVVSVFWSFMTDLFNNEQARRLFAVIATGGTIGAITGPLLTTFLVRSVGNAAMLLISAGLLGLSIISIHQLIAWQRTRHEANETHRLDDKPLGGAILDGIRLAFSSPYLLGICLLMLLFTLLSTFLYFQQAQIVKDTFSDSETRTSVFAAIDLSVNLLTLLLQTFVTSRLVKGVGLGITLALLPLLLAFGFVLLGFYPALPILIAVQVIRRAGNYAIMRPAREMLYVVLSREEKYKAKNFLITPEAQLLSLWCKHNGTY
ncbi:MAG: MFS transporter [Candidatus Thiodiazotropha sp.]